MSAAVEERIEHRRVGPHRLVALGVGDHGADVAAHQVEEAVGNPGGEEAGGELDEGRVAARIREGGALHEAGEDDLVEEVLGREVALRQAARGGEPGHGALVGGAEIRGGVVEHARPHVGGGDDGVEADLAEAAEQRQAALDVPHAVVDVSDPVAVEIDEPSHPWRRP